MSPQERQDADAPGPVAAEWTSTNFFHIVYAGNVKPKAYAELKRIAQSEHTIGHRHAPFRFAYTARACSHDCHNERKPAGIPLSVEKAFDVIHQPRQIVFIRPDPLATPRFLPCPVPHPQHIIFISVDAPLDEQKTTSTGDVVSYGATAQADIRRREVIRKAL
ncbi:MAG: hypothetical protein LBG43_09215 [Treponema sp.]|jgi:hypothetical protein|nr:hypothetical protein [Treponema sp.]